MTEEEKIICKQFLNDADKTHSCNEYKLLIALLEQEPTTENDVPENNVGNIYICSCGYGWDKSKVVRHHFCPNCGKAVEPTTKNDLAVDCISRQAVLDLVADYDLSMGQVVKGIHDLPSVTLIRPKGIRKWE